MTRINLLPGIKSEYKRLARKPYVMVGAALVVLLAAEVGWHVAERSIGKYLLWQNPGREKIGRSWQEDQNRLAAHTRLEQITRDQRERVTELEGIATFTELAAYLRTNPRLVLPASQFSLIYQSVPELFRSALLPAGEVVAIHREGQITSLLVDQLADRLSLNFMNAGNQLVYQTSLPNEQVEMMQNHGRELQLDLRTEERFQEHMLTAVEFFDILDRQFYDERANIIKTVPVLTDFSAELVRVAFANKIISGFVETAFALDDMRVRIYYLPEEWTIVFTSRSRSENESSFF